MTTTTDLVKRLEALYRDLTKAHSHPFDWMCVLRRPSIWRRYAISGWKRNVAIFASHGFLLTDTVADRFRLSEPQRWDEDCGGAIIRRLTCALQSQMPEAALLKAKGAGDE